MSIEQELTALLAQVGRLRDSARHARDDELMKAVVALATTVELLQGSVERLGELITQSFEKHKVELERQILNVTGAQNQQMAMVNAVGTKIDGIGQGRGDDSAIRALIAAHDQLTHLISVARIDHSDIVAGQRSNIELTLAQLGIQPIEVPMCFEFSAATMESASQTVAVGDPALHGRVAEVVRSGWQTAGGTRCIRLAQVKVFEFVSAGPPGSTPAPTQPLNAQEHHRISPVAGAMPTGGGEFVG